MNQVDMTQSFLSLTSGFRNAQEYVFYSSQIAFVHKAPQKGCRGLSSFSRLLPPFQVIPFLDKYIMNYVIKLQFYYFVVIFPQIHTTYFIPAYFKIKSLKRIPEAATGIPSRIYLFFLSTPP